MHISHRWCIHDTIHMLLSNCLSHRCHKVLEILLWNSAPCWHDCITWSTADLNTVLWTSHKCSTASRSSDSGDLYSPLNRNHCSHKVVDNAAQIACGTQIVNDWCWCDPLRQEKHSPPVAAAGSVDIRQVDSTDSCCWHHIWSLPPIASAEMEMPLTSIQLSGFSESVPAAA